MEKKLKCLICFIPGDVNGDDRADLVCAQPDGGVAIYQTQITETGIDFPFLPYEDKRFGFCHWNQDEKAKVVKVMSQEVKHLNSSTIP